MSHRYIAHGGSAGQSFATVMGTSPAGVFVNATDADASPLGTSSAFFFGTTYQAYESFLSFDTSALAVTPGAVTLTLVCSFASGTPLTLVVALYDWGATIEAADWRTPAQLSALPEAGRIVLANPQAADVYAIDIDPTLLVVGGQTRFVVFELKESTGTAPTNQNNLFLEGPVDASPPDLTWVVGGATIDTVTPASGSLAGGTLVTITGSGFAVATDVTVGGVSVAYSITDDTEITFTTDAHATGSVAVVVVVPGSDGATTFTFADVLPLADACLALQVGGTFLADGATADGDGIVYTPQALDGWFDSIPQRTGTLEANPRGETVTVNRENGRTVDVQIVAHIAGGQLPLGNVLCFTAIETIKTAFRAVFVPVLIQVADPSGQQRTMLARRVGPIKSQILGNGAAVQFTIPMLGENPILVIV